ncbi:ornithine cyclodeaminase family protein [Salinadaptatus halalkaliphilus]|uniref:Ornithine cyclodeaminase family protein n=1 Tax=Salinadaptatus halalkaliphilus TaxID=2419781 RepID=A0A4S3TRC5_9EURY|nr:ornithine cyclodeaminase family protein [Salinadaptatus halalkaliphilus]THE65903.1 ornithine cyclodeaminase family protein [Salinadaptatus halalkaliphilus]
MVRALAADDVASVLDLEALLPVIADAFERQFDGAVERPARPHYPIGIGLDPDAPTEPTGTGLCMPAYIHGSEYAVTKLVAVCPDNRERDRPTVSAQLSVVDAETGRPAGYLEGNRITNARTGCIGGLAAHDLATEGPLEVGVIGAGVQARWQVRAIAAAVGSALESVRVYSPSDSRRECASVLERELDASVSPVSSPETAVSDAEIVVTATTSEEPVFPGEKLAEGTLVIAIGAYTPEMQELDATTIDRADRIFGDVPAEAIETGDLREHRDRTVRPFGAVVAEDTDRRSADATAGRQSTDEIVVLESVGSAVLDAATATFVFDRAVDRELGTTVALD